MLPPANDAGDPGSAVNGTLGASLVRALHVGEATPRLASGLQVTSSLPASAAPPAPAAPPLPPAPPGPAGGGFELPQAICGPNASVSTKIASRSIAPTFMVASVRTISSAPR